MCRRMNSKETLAFLKEEKTEALLERLYKGEREKNQKRYQELVEKFKQTFGDKDICLFSSPGRTEISGNHTDHNHGKVLAGSINLDCIGVAAKNSTGLIHIVSETFSQDFTVSVQELERGERHVGTVELVKGLVKGFQSFGFQIGGFDLYTSSTVISAAGVSSSAAFEMLICVILNHFYNEDRLNIVNYAHIGQFAENQYWDKASGLLDQMACAAGGLITIDFKNPKEPEVEKIAFDFGAQKHKLIIVNTGKGHADLSEDYSSVPKEMKSVAAYFGKEVCADITEKQVLENLAAVREACGDRAVMRALHFFEENKRVEAEVLALKENRFNDFLSEITESGNSSWKWLQNCFTNHSYQEQGISIALALTELFFFFKKCGACRIHGGGFAGVIMAMLPEELADEYADYMEAALGKGNVYLMSIRPYGAVCLNLLASEM